MVKVCSAAKKLEEIKKYLENIDLEYSVEDCVGRCDLCHGDNIFYINEDEETVVILKKEME
ncbi:MAG: hypothetical protein ACQESN_04515 [Thermotogota bacterium]